MRTKYPNVLAAVEAREQHKSQIDSKDLWAIGDAIIKDIGAFHAGESDSIGKRLIEASKELGRLGHREYKPNYLNNLRNTASAFPRSRRNHDVAFATYFEAASPDFLDWIIDEKGTDISKREVRAMRGRYRILVRQERRKQIAEAKEAVKQAQTPQAKAKAEEKVEELGSVMPEPSPHKVARPSGGIAEALNTMTDVMDIDLKAGQLVKELRKQQATINEMRNRIDVEYIDALVEKYEDVSKVATQIADSLGKSRLKRYATITGGKA